MNTQDAKRVLETALICAQQPLPLRDLRSLFDDQLGADTIRGLLDELVRDWEDRGVELVALAGGWRFQSRPELREYLDRLHPEKPPKYTRATLETLAIIAYRQPVTRPEVEDIRGVDSGAVIKALLERRLVKILGKKEEVGRPILYGTTKEFLEFFALRDLSSLPTLREFQELSKEHAEIVEKETAPPPEKPSAKGTVDELADPTFRKRLDDTNQDSEAALAELETAISTADERTKAAAKVLNPPAPAAPAPVPPTTTGEGG